MELVLSKFKLSALSLKLIKFNQELKLNVLECTYTKNKEIGV